jgi:hypothetical protein
MINLFDWLPLSGPTFSCLYVGLLDKSMPVPASESSFKQLYGLYCFSFRINLYYPDLILHLQRQVSQFLAPWHLLPPLCIGDHWETCSWPFQSVLCICNAQLREFKIRCSSTSLNSVDDVVIPSLPMYSNNQFNSNVRLKLLMYFSFFLFVYSCISS